MSHIIGNTIRKEFKTPMNDEFEDVHRKMDESKQRLDEIMSAAAEQEDIAARKNNNICLLYTSDAADE